MGCFLPAFNPDVWPPSNPSRRGTVATGSARGLKTWLFTVRAGFGTLGCVLTAFTPDVWPPSNPPRQGTAAAGCRLWHHGLCFNGFQLGHLAAAWLFTVRAGFGTLGCVLTAFTPDVWPPSKPPRQGTAAAGCRLWHIGLCFNGFQSGRLAALKPSLAGYGCIRQPLPLLGASTGGVRLPLALLPQNFAFHRFRQALAQWAVF